jgi:hypothetical protein
MANERPITLAEARTLLYQHATDDPADADGTFKRRLNEALERIYSEGLWSGATERVDIATAGYIVDELCTLPYAYASMIAAAVNDCPTPIMASQLEFIESGPGVQDKGDGGSFIIDLGFVDVGGQKRRQYKFLMDIGASDEVEGILAKRFVYLDDDADLVVPANLGALKHALLAICFEDEGDIVRGGAYWDECYRILNAEISTENVGVHEPNPMQQWGFMTDKPESIL